MLNGLLEFIPEIQIADATEAVTDWLTDTFSFVFDPINKYFGNFMEFVADDVLMNIPIGKKHAAKSGTKRFIQITCVNGFRYRRIESVDFDHLISYYNVGNEHQKYGPN